MKNVRPAPTIVAVILGFGVSYKGNIAATHEVLLNDSKMMEEVEKVVKKYYPDPTVLFDKKVQRKI